ncbi:MAG: chemotaxis response regulator protein-glutamate methylesterase [Acidobacteria bacterium]|nr:chemotaxis response regulator protein-glutamate methylesterase [Acidobacteriota bacterium]
MTAARPTRVLLVDDSAIVRKLLGDALRTEPDIEVVGGASDPYVARDMIVRHQPDLITLDIEMPRMDGLSFLKRLMAHHPIPAIVISSLTQTGSAASVEALRLGAIDVIAKPGGPQSVGQVTERLKQRIRAFRASPRVRLAATVPRQTPAEDRTGPTLVRQGKDAKGLIAIGASTGGTQAIEALLTRLPADLPPIVIVQHMPAGFTKAFADRLNTVCPMRVKEAENGDPVERGSVLVAPGDHHMVIERQGIRLSARLTQGPQVHHQRPAVDVLFASVARLMGVPTVAALLTGMGADGADGMVALRQSGAITIAEDESSCVVFGMPKEAIARGGAVHVTSLLAMPQLMLGAFGQLAHSRAS